MDGVSGVTFREPGPFQRGNHTGRPLQALPPLCSTPRVLRPGWHPQVSLLTSVRPGKSCFDPYAQARWRQLPRVKTLYPRPG